MAKCFACGIEHGRTDFSYRLCSTCQYRADNSRGAEADEQTSRAEDMGAVTREPHTECDNTESVETDICEV